MKKISPGVRFAWMIASWEAAALKHKFIEPEHVLIGLFSLVKGLTTDLFKELHIDEKRKLKEEIAAVKNIVQCFGVTTTVLRRHLRNSLVPGKYKHKLNLVHRSIKTKYIFNQATELSENGREFNALHLFAAVLKNPNTNNEAMLCKNNIDPIKMSQKILDYDSDTQAGSTEEEITREQMKSIHTFSRNTNISRLTIMFDDIVGSMALFNKLGDEEFYKLIKYHNSKIKKILDRLGKGEIIKSTGDGLLIIFSDTVIAIEGALMIQRAFLDEEVLKVRIGMDMGDVKQVLDQKSRDIFGIKVSAASRITEAAEGGHILTSNSVYESAKGYIKNKHIEWKFLGSHNFKPGEPTIQIYEVYDSTMPVEPMYHIDTSAIQDQEQAAKISLLDEFGRDLTHEAKENKLGPFAGRRNEILQIIQTLAQKYSNNPILVGRAGVGKTSLVEALAVRIANGRDSEFLAQKRIIALNMSKILSGLVQKSQFEERLGNVIEEAISQPDVILFIDEIHNFVGINQVDNLMNVAHLLNPIIVQGDLRFIGTTTEDEYNRCIQPDASLERSFQRILIEEPSRKDTLDMLNIFRQKLEEYHKVWITDRALEAAIDLTIEFDQEHALPAKAIDLLDEAGAQIHIPDLSMLGGRQPDDLGVKRGGAHTILNVLTIAQILAQRTGIPINKIMESIEEE